MPRQTVKEKTALQVTKLTQPGYHRVGGVSGLCLQVKRSGTRSWILRLTFGGQRRDIGLGSYPSVSVSMARARARMMLDQVWAGNDPLAEKREQQAVALATKKAASSPTFEECMRGFVRDKTPHMRNPARARQQIENSLLTYACPTIGELPVAEITLDHILTILRPIWTGKPETASRVRNRIERVIAWATVHGFREGDNPARWRGHLDLVLASGPAPNGKSHQPALAIDDLPPFMSALKARSTPSARALEFLILTAARSAEVRGATWAEMDMKARVWTIPAGRMKASAEHRIPLSAQAVKLLEDAPRFAGTEVIWPGQDLRNPMSDMTIAKLVKTMHADEELEDRKGWVDPRSGRVAVPHGFRSTFRDWVAERTEWEPDMAEIALAHRVGSAVERAYRRGDMLERRRAMMQGWADFAYGSVRAVPAAAQAEAAPARAG